MTLKWNGNKLLKKLNKAIAGGLNDTVTAVIPYALNHHPNWQYRSGLAEGSIQQREFATPSKHFALWGSVWTEPGTNYVWYLEFNHAPFLRAAADIIYPGLTKRIKARLN